MAIIGGGAILFAACLFYLYALVKFHREAVEPPRKMRHFKKGVIRFPRTTVKRKLAKPREAQGSQDVMPPLPFGVRRLAVRRGH